MIEMIPMILVMMRIITSITINFKKEENCQKKAKEKKRKGEKENLHKHESRKEKKD